MQSVSCLGSFTLDEHFILIGFAASRRCRCGPSPCRVTHHARSPVPSLIPSIFISVDSTDAQEQRRGSPQRVRARLAHGRCSAERSRVGGGRPTRPRVPVGVAHAWDGVACPCCGCGASGAARGELRVRCDPCTTPILHPSSPRPVG